MERYTESIPGTKVAFDLVPIRGGEFLMGSPPTDPGHQKDEFPQHRVQIAPFWMGIHEVTWNEFDLWTYSLDAHGRDANPSKKSHRDKFADTVTRPSKPYTDLTMGMGREGYPAICMTHHAAITYCKWLSIKTGRYYRLPTEAEWEYACRAGTTTAYSFGDDKSQLGDYAWYWKNSAEVYHKVGLKKPNPWGLFDMQGNVSEWCLDHYHLDAYQKAPTDNPHFPATSTYRQVVRGGNYLSGRHGELRSAHREFSTEKWQKSDPDVEKSKWYHSDAPFVGFRVVRPFVPRVNAEQRKRN